MFSWHYIAVLLLAVIIGATAAWAEPARFLALC
jgi:hypothetical protein